MSDDFSLNIAVGSTGAIPTPPSVIWIALQQYLASGYPQFDLPPNVPPLTSVATAPGFTVLPGGLIEDILSTDTAGIVLMDSAAVEAINSLTPNSANSWLLFLLGQMYGVPLGVTVNTSVYVVFSGPNGYNIPPGFIVSDGTYQYVVQDGGAIGSGGASQPLFCVATQAGSWPVLANTVNAIVSSVPAPYTSEITCNNPNTGTPSAGAQTEADYRSQVIQAGLATAQGMPSFLKAQLRAVQGVQSNLVAVKQISGGGWEIICGGNGDPYEIAGAIFAGVGDLSTLVASTINVTGITNANPGVVTTDLNHGLVTGQSNVQMAGILGMTAANGGPYTVHVLSEKTFSFGVNTTSFGTYISGGVVTPNNRNISVDIIDYPDTYSIPFVNPPAQTVLVQLTWNTNAPNFVSAAAVSQLSVGPLANYINSIPVGNPINLFELGDVFTAAVASLIPSQYISRMLWTVSINTIDTDPESGTGLVFGDPESYFTCSATGITVTQG